MTAIAGAATLISVVVGTLGLAIGSFLNVVVYRVPNGMSVVAPASACPHCGTSIRRHDNIPVLSWLLLGGRCRDCRSPISWRYPAVELATALFFVVVAIVFGQGIAEASSTASTLAAIATLLAFLYLSAITVALALIDLDVHRLPNAIVLPAYGVAAVLLTTASAVTGDWGALLRALVGMAALFAFYFVVAFVKPGGMGFGDVKLAGVIGMYLAWLGWSQLAVGAFAAFLLGGIVGIVLIIARGRSRTSGIPFGPWMLAGAWIAIFAGDPLARLYLRLVGLG